MNSTAAMWEKLPEETPKAYAAFLRYRDLGPAKRSLAKAAAWHYGGGPQTVPKPSQINQLKEWNRTFRWQLRVAAYDTEQDRLAQEQRHRDAEEARERAVRGAHLLQSIALKAMQEMNQGRLLADGNRVPEHNPNATILRYYREGVELEFLALGLPISVVRQQVEGPSPEQIGSQQKIETMRRARKGFGG